MKYMKQTVLLLLMSLSVINVYSQNIDSLINVLNNRNLSPLEQIMLYEKLSHFYVSNDLEKGIIYANKGLQIAENKHNKKMASIFNNHLGIIYYNKSSLDTSYIYLKKALDLAIDSNDDVHQMTAYSSLGNLFRLKQNYQEALDYYIKAVSIHNMPLSEIHASTFSNIAIIHRILNNPDRAFHYFEQALQIAEQLDLDAQKTHIIYGLGTVYADLEDNNKAIENFQKALELSRKTGNKPYEIMSTNSLAMCFCINKEFEKSLTYAHEGMRISEAYGAPRYIQGAWGTLADIYREVGDYKKCVEVSLRLWDIDSTSVEDASYTAYTLAVANIHLGEKDQATRFMDKYYEIMKEGNKKSLHNSLVDMEVKYETEKKEMRIATLEKERRLYVWLGIVGILLVFALSIVLWLTKKNARKERQLIATQSVLDGEMGERSRLAQDLHDRLSGSLAAIKIGLSNNQETLQVIQGKLDGCIEEVRRIAHNLRPVSLQYGLKAALEDFAAQFPNVQFRFFGEDSRIDERIEIVVYSCISELTNNSIRHSGAKNINLQMVQGGSHISFTVQDDGSGFDEQTVVKGIGLKSIRDRVVSCNGKIDISSLPGKGTETTIELKIDN